MGRRCFACYPRDARDAEGRAVDRAQVRDAHERLGSDSEVVMLEQESDGMHGPRVTSLSNGGTGVFPEQEAGAVGLASGAQTMSREA